MTKNGLSGLLHNALFGARQDINQALCEASAEASSPNSTCASRVASLWVLMNTIANEVMQLDGITERSVFTLQGHIDGDLHLYGLFETEAEAVESMNKHGFDEYGYHNANTYFITEWRGSKILNEYKYEGQITFKRVEV